MKLLILGAGSSQQKAILKAREKGHTVIVSDYLPDAPGLVWAHHREQVSTFDVEKNIEVARKYRIDGVLTLGTDQPVYTAARVAEALRLPFFLDAATAKAVTNKRIMKDRMKNRGVPTVSFTYLGEHFSRGELRELRFPLVIKPVDSQGQRGVYRLENMEELRRYSRYSLGYSRESEILVEEFYESEEITVSGWVEEGKLYFLSVTDRLSFRHYPHIGVCYAHRYPSRHLKTYHREIEALSCQIVEVFNIKNGPVYFQLLLGADGLKVNEIACRLGGAYEDQLLTYLTGLDILDVLVDASLGKTPDLSPLYRYNYLQETRKASIQLVFAKPGIITCLGDPEKIKKLPGVIAAGYNIKPGHRIAKIENAKERTGYMIIVAKDEKELSQRLDAAFELYRLEKADGENLVIHPDWQEV